MSALPIELHDRTGERCVACRKGVYEHITLKMLSSDEESVITVVRADRVRCSECGATVDRWREG